MTAPKVFTIIAFSFVLANCSPMAFMGGVTGSSTSSGSDSGSGSNSAAGDPDSANNGSGSNGSNGGSGSSKNGTSSGPQATLCDVLVDQTGIYFSQDEQQYVAITGVTECAYNAANGISGPCDPNVQMTLIKPQDNPNLQNPDLTMDAHKGITVIPTSGQAMFLCISKTGRVIIQTKKQKILLVLR